MIEEKKDFRFNISILAILMLFMASSVGSFESPGMQVIIEYWTARGVSVESVRMLTTIQSIVSLPFILAVGRFVGKRISYKATAITSAVCVLVGSMAPFFINSSWTIVLVFRGLAGVGVGLAACRTALMLASVPADLHTKYMGLGQSFMIGIGIISGPIVGVLSSISWRHVFLINLYTFVVLFFMFFIKEPPKTVQDPEEKKHVRAAFKPSMLKYAIAEMVNSTFALPAIIGVATYLAGHKIGNATLAGTVLMLYSLGAIALSYLGAVQKILKRFTLPFCYALAGIANALLVLFPGVVTTFIAMFMIGFGSMGAFALMQVYSGNSVSREQMPLATSILITGKQLGMFASVWAMKFAHSVFHLTTDADSVYAMGIMVFAVLACLALVRGIFVPKEKQETEGSNEKR